MFIFDTNSRVEKIAEGIRFYEPDIFCLNYLLYGDQIIDVELKYRAPGFGLVMAEKSGGSIYQSRMLYLFKLGDGDFRVFQKRGTIQEAIRVESAEISPSIDGAPIKLRFQLRDDRLYVSKFVKGSDKALVALGSCVLPLKLTDYFVGFYSNADNVIVDMKIQGKVPETWTINTANIDGGRVKLIRDAFVFENCVHDAEVEQDHILLKKGTYYLKYEKEPVDKKYDIEAFVISKDVKLPSGNDGQEDEVKSILKDGKFQLKKDTEVNVKFKGCNGQISKISLTSIPDSMFVETDSNFKDKKGSYIDIQTKGLKSVTWEATIIHTPKDELIDGKNSYALIETKHESYTLTSTRIRLNEKFCYTYDVKTSTLDIKSMETTAANKITLSLQADDNGIIRIMRNMTAYIYSLKIERNNGTTTDLVVEQTIKKFVPAAINGPIIVADDKGAVLDLSASYRELIVPSVKYACYAKEDIVLPEGLPTAVANIKVYGIPKGVRLNPEGKTIKEIASNYVLVSPKLYIRTATHVSISENERSKYAHIVVEYASVEDFIYEITNYEREIFEGKLDVLCLAHMPSKGSVCVTVYGIKKNSYTNEDMIRRVPSGMISSIDYYAEEYEIIPNTAYTLDFSNASITLDRSYQDKYEEYVVDYLKDDSYAINIRKDSGQYEVNISSSNKELFARYDLGKNGANNQVLMTGIAPDNNKYIILQEKE